MDTNKWNQIWNQAWNSGYNLDPQSGVNLTNDPVYGGAVTQGFQAGLQERQSRGTGLQQTSPTQFASGGSQPSSGGSIAQSGGVGGDPFAGLRNTINSGWDSYTNSLNDILNGLGGQRSSQENTINDQFNSSKGDLNLQNTQGNQALDTQSTLANQNQAKSLQDIANNIRNGFQAGNVYLGAQGAGDSSAANQYSYALTKLGTQQRTGVTNNTANILNDIGSRRTNLSNIYNNEMNKLSSSRDQAINQVAQWFANQQANIQGQIGQAGLGRSHDLQALSQNALNQALNALGTINSAVTGQAGAINNWAQGVHSDINNASGQLNNQSNVAYNMPTADNLVGAPQVTSSGSIFVPTGFGATSDQKKNNTNSLFGLA